MRELGVVARGRRRGAVEPGARRPGRRVDGCGRRRWRRSDSATPGLADATSGSDATPGPADAGAPGGFPATFTKFGSVGVRWRHMASGDSTDTEALFTDYGALGSGCTTVTMGACVHLKCPGPDGGTFPPNSRSGDD